ncbi:urea ABC transporter ATP-binding protein UrtD [Zhongshania aliphaticivorans]|uniref:urea ABC transporter ATP-binding protein UrtD n=1 Tax=Zhongshania aliphaticivorans TaxID=1470434 RepID=UPI0012E4F012|nr:urea ABC transporter ATP-binding protein UrtD [Zhongshania aliphaticivorans]CAA0118236.1 Cell division ATP-binding protein FtsE [Zhongshania aliphaticivorans]
MSAVVKSPGFHSAEMQSMLYLNGVTKSFDGFKAINNLSLDIYPGELRAIIGPNGAGKSTMMDIITGKTRPDSGEVRFRDSIDLTQYDEADIANLGIGRKFQKPTVIETLTVWENVELALAGTRSVLRALLHKLSSEQADKIDEVIKLVGLKAKTNDLAGSLSHGQKQWLEIGMLIVQGPELLLVDEPAAGMTDHETMETAALLKEINKDHTVVVVEHDMDFIKALDSKVTVLHEGGVLAEGRLEVVSANPRVIEVYLGR